MKVNVCVFASEVHKYYIK